MSKKEKKDDGVVIDDFASMLASEINKSSKDSKVAYILDSPDNPANVEGWVSTGSSILDVCISNRPYGGLPVGRITEINGLQQSGKSLICTHILAETQRMGGVGVLIDTENASNMEFMEAVGLDPKRLLYVSTNALEDIFEHIEMIIEKVRVADKNKMVTIVVDSLAAASPKNELASAYKKEGYGTEKAMLISQAMRKITGMIGKQKITLIFTNQLRLKMNAMAFGDQYTTSGGLALPFHASVRLRLKTIGKIKAKVRGIDKVVGVKVQSEVIKNRLGPPLRKAEFEIYFDRGIDDYGSWLAVMKETSIVKQTGAWYVYYDTDTGEELKFQAKDFTGILAERADIKEQMYKQICKELILQYKTNDLTSDDVVIDDSETFEINE